jgi:hypothetical protein
MQKLIFQQENEKNCALRGTSPTIGGLPIRQQPLLPSFSHDNDYD